MKLLGRIVAVTSLLLLAACGGGGGNPGGSGTGSGSGGGGSGGGTVGTGSVVVQTYKGTTLVKSFAASDLTVYAKATVKDESGKGVPDAIVTFSESTGLLAFAPASKTALTNSDGVAEIDIKAATTGSLGATQLVAKTTVKSSVDGSDMDLQGSQNLSITAATAQDPQADATAINFKGAVPADKSIVIAGSGGNGRSETALLTFVVVDSNGSPIKGVAVDFNVVPAGAVILNTPTGTTNSSGEVTASVNSKATPISVTVNATVQGHPTISVVSDTLTVTTDVATQGGFDLSASKFNLDADLSGDSSALNIKIVDQFGNPVADGVPVVATTDFGRVGTSSRGGCTTSNGGCSVPYEVQNPRPADGTAVTVAFSTQTGQGAVISDTLNLWVTSVGWLRLYQAGGPVTNLNLVVTDPAACKFAGVTLQLGTPGGFAAPAETSVEVSSVNGISTPSITFGSPTLDRASTRTQLMLSVSGKSGSAGGNDQWIFKFTAKPSKTVSMVTLPVSVPACPAVP